MAFYLIAIAMILLGQLLGSLVSGVILELLAVWFPSLRESALCATLLIYLFFLGIWVVAFLYLWFSKDRPILNVLRVKDRKNAIGSLLLGLLIGSGANGLCILAAWLHQDIAFSFAAFEPLALIGVFAAVFVQSSAEELVCRGFLYQSFLRSYKKPSIAIVGNSLLFALFHLSNDGVTVLSLLNIFLTGIWFSFIVYYLDSIWGAFAAHTAWNFTQNIIFGLPNSGMTVPYSVLKLDTTAARNSFAYDIGFGIEGTLLASIVVLLGCVVLYFWGSRKKKAGE